MLKNYIKNLLLLVLVLFAISANAQVLSLQQTNTTTSGFRAVAANETVSFPTAAVVPSVLTFRITNTSAVALQLTGTPTVSVAGANAALFTVSQPALTTLALNQSTTFTVTYQPTAAPIHNAQISIINNSAVSPFVVNLKGAGHSLYGPMYPILPVFGTITTGSNAGTIGRVGGKDLYISTVSMGTQTTTYWGPQISSDGDLGLKVSLDNSTYTLEENLTYSSAESNFAIGKAVWRGRTLIQNAISGTTVPVYIRATLTTKKPDNTIIPLINPASIGLSEQVGGLVQFSSISDFLVANYFIEASLNQITWQPYLDFYDAYPTPPGPLPGAGIGNAYSTVSNGFYWVNFGPTITQNQILSVAEGGTAAITTAFLNATDKEDMPASPQKLVFRFETTNPGTSPLNFGTGVLKLNGVTLTKTDTFTLQDIQNGLLTYVHNGSETVYEEFQFSLIDSKSKIAADGPNTIFSFKINITAVNDAPVSQNLNFTTSYVTPFTDNLTVTDPDSTVFTYTIVTPPTQGTISLDGTTGQFTYTPTSGTPGTDTFTYSVNDGTTTSNISTVTITLINLPPAGTNTQFTTLEGTAVTGNVVATDPEGSVVTYQLVTQATDGIATIAANGAFTYTPNAAQYGNDTFTYTAQDAQGNLSSVITVTIVVRPRLDAGDLIVADRFSLIHYDPSTSQNIVLSQGQLLAEAINVAFKNNVGLFVYDRFNGLIKVDPYTGIQTLVSPASNFSGAGPIGGPPGMLIDDTGFLVMCDATGIKRVNPANGVVTPLFSGGLLSYPTGVAYLNSGDLIVSDAGMMMGGTSRIIRITPAGVQTVVSTGNNIVLPLDFALLDQNTLVVSDGGSFAGGTDKIYKVDIATGNQTILSTGGSINIPSGIDIYQNNVYAVNKQGTKLVLNINGTTGVQSTVMPVAPLISPWGLLVIGQSIIFNNTTITNTTCTGSNDGSAVVTFSGGTAPYTYTLNGSASATATSPLTISNLTAGSYNLLITDSAAATASTTIVIGTITDVTNPTITAPANVNVNADAGSCNATGVVLGTPVFADNCTGATVANNAPATFPKGNTTVTWTVTDAAGNTATATQTVTVTDNQNPTITAPANVNVNADSGSCNATGVVLGTPVFADNCTGATVANNAPATFPKGNTTVTWTVTDAAGNTATATQTVTVIDNQNPTITAPANVTVNSDAGSCNATGVALGTPVFADNCTGATVANNAPVAFPTGTTTVTWTATDASGNTATATQTVTVTDNQNPTITAPANVNVNADAGSCTVTGVALGTPIFADNCTGSTVANNAPASYPKGNTTVTWTVTDASGNTATATQTVTVTDNQNPTITAPANVNANTDAGSCTATGITLGTPTFADNCTGSTVANNAPATFPIGNTTVTWTATDAVGNTATANQTVTVIDNQNPTITAPANVNTNTDPGSCFATVVLGTPIVADNCTGLTVTNNAPAVFPIGMTTVTWTVTDVSGNTATTNQFVTVVDNQDPTIVTPPNTTLNVDNGGCQATSVTLPVPTFFDNCTGATITSNALANFPIGNTIVTWTATDAAGNTTTATQIITVIDNQNPTITAPTDVTASINTASCRAVGVPLGAPIVADNCVGPQVTNNAPSSFPIGTTVVTWIAIDSSGNTATDTQNVTITDNQAPTITAPADITVEGTENCSVTGLNLGQPAATDNCSGFTISNDAPAAFPLGTTVVTWTVTDTAGNVTTDTQTVTVTAPAAPVVNPEQEFCIGATVAELQVQGQNIVWYDAETAGNVVATTEVLEDDTTYYAATNNSGCESLTRTAVHVTIHTTPAPTGSATQEFCNEATVSDLTATGDQIRWFSSAESTTPLDVSTELVHESTYYASQTDVATGCESQTRFTVQAIIHTVPLAEGKTNYTYCSDMTPTIADLAVDYPNSVWYADEAGTILLEAAERLTNGSYYVRLEDPSTGCESPAGFEVIVRFMKCDVVTYNYLTPDENTKNEYLYFENIENFPDNNLKIFNRQGKKLFETYNYGQNNNYFYGKSSSDASGALPTGTYFYLLEYRNPVTMKTEVKKGFFYINNNE